MFLDLITFYRFNANWRKKKTFFESPFTWTQFIFIFRLKEFQRFKIILKLELTFFFIWKSDPREPLVSCVDDSRWQLIRHRKTCFTTPSKEILFRVSQFLYHTPYAACYVSHTTHYQPHRTHHTSHIINHNIMSPKYSVCYNQKWAARYFLDSLKNCCSSWTHKLFGRKICKTVYHKPAVVTMPHLTPKYLR